jgi:hypothetical protein
MVPGQVWTWIAVLSLALGGVLCAGGEAGWAATESPAQDNTPFRYDPKNHRDPFVSLIRDGRLVTATATQKIVMSKPMLYGILWDSGGRSLALINNEEVGVGDLVGGYRVKEIRQDAVVMAADGGEPFVLDITFESVAPAEATQAATGEERP